MRGQPAHYLEHDELIAGNNYSYLKLSEKLKKDRKTKKKERTEERLRKRKYTHSNASSPFEQIFIIRGIFFFSWKRSDEAKRRQRRARNKRRRLEIKQIKKNAHEELVLEKKEKTDNRRKTVFCQKKKKNQEKFHQLWRQTEREKERLLHLQMKNKTKSINSSDSAVAVTNSFLEIPREQKVHVNMDSDSKNLITLWEGKFGKVTLDLPFIEKCLLQ